MKKVIKKISPMNIYEKFKMNMRLWRIKQQREVKDFASRKENLYNHVKKDMMSENLYILICTALFSLALFGMGIIAFLLACNLIVKIIL